MRMFRRRTGNNVEGAATTTDDRGGYQTDDGQTYARDDGSAPVTDDRQTYDAPATPGRDDRQTRAARTTPERDDRAAYATGPGSAAADDGRRWHHGPARALMQLLAHRLPARVRADLDRGGMDLRLPPAPLDARPRSRHELVERHRHQRVRE